MNLKEKSCTPCQGGIPSLEKSEVESFLKQIDEWEPIENYKMIRKGFSFQNFREAISFTNQIGQIAEQQGHHPDIFLGYGYVEVLIQTHAIDGLHENDFILAAKIDEIF